MVDTITTIGYSGFSSEEFLKTLKENNIDVLIDVRSSPYSEFFRQYNKEPLSVFLKQNGIFYRNYAREFGARQDNPEYRTPTGYLDFSKFSKSAPFLEGVDKICKSMQQGYRVAFMCSEKNPINCHRAILVSRTFHELGYHVKHLLPEGSYITQTDLEQELLDLYYPERFQLSLFQPSSLSESYYIDKAYQLQNEKIGYVMAESEGA